MTTKPEHDTHEQPTAANYTAGDLFAVINLGFGHAIVGRRQTYYMGPEPLSDDTKRNIERLLNTTTPAAAVPEHLTASMGYHPEYARGWNERGAAVPDKLVNVPSVCSGESPEEFARNYAYVCGWNACRDAVLAASPADPLLGQPNESVGNGSDLNELSGNSGQLRVETPSLGIPEGFALVPRDIPASVLFDAGYVEGFDYDAGYDGDKEHAAWWKIAVGIAACSASKVSP